MSRYASLGDQRRPCIFCEVKTAWKRPSPTRKENAVCFNCIPRMSQIWDYAGLTEPEGD